MPSGGVMGRGWGGKQYCGGGGVQCGWGGVNSGGVLSL